MTMSHPQYRATRVPTSLFEQTLYDTDQLFYATFPGARDAALEQSIYDPPSPTDCPTSHQSAQPLEYDIRNELDISSTSVSLSGPTQDLSYRTYPQLHFDYSKGLYPQQPFLSRHQSHPSYDSPPRPIENVAPVYIPSSQPYHLQYSFEPTSQHIHHSHRSPVTAQEPTFLIYQPSNASPQVTTDIQETVSDGRPENPRYGFRQLNCHVKPSTLKSTSNCQLGVMRLDRRSDRSHLDLPTDSQSHPTPSETLHISSCQMTPSPTEFLLSSVKSPSIGLSSLPSKNILEKKPVLACFFCRGRKIACGPPLPGSIKKTCNQCQKRLLHCSYPTRSRRGMRKKKSDADTK